MQGVIVGAGFFAGFQAEAWGRIPDVRITAVSDVDEVKARAFASRWGIPNAYTDASEMIARVRPDFVDIATRPESHLGLATVAATHGANVICQKPLAPNWQDSVALVQLCRQRGVRCLVHENWRFQPWYRQCRRLLDDGAIGRLFYAGVRMRTGDGRGATPYATQPYFREMPRLLIYETGIHYLDTLRYLVGEIDQVSCRLQRVNPVIAGEDVALVQLVFAGGALGILDANRFAGSDPPDVAFGTLTLEGDSGTLHVAADGQISLTEYGGRSHRHVYDIPTGGYRGDSVFALQAQLASALRTGAVAESEGEDYLKTTAAVFACYESAATDLPQFPTQMLRNMP